MEGGKCPGRGALDAQDERSKIPCCHHGGAGAVVGGGAAKSSSSKEV